MTGLHRSTASSGLARARRRHRARCRAVPPAGRVGRATADHAFHAASWRPSGPGDAAAWHDARQDHAGGRHRLDLSRLVVDPSTGDVKAVPADPATLAQVRASASVVVRDARGLLYLFSSPIALVGRPANNIVVPLTNATKIIANEATQAGIDLGLDGQVQIAGLGSTCTCPLTPPPPTPSLGSPRCPSEPVLQGRLPRSRSTRALHGTRGWARGFREPKAAAADQTSGITVRLSGSGPHGAIRVAGVAPSARASFSPGALALSNGAGPGHRQSRVRRGDRVLTGRVDLCQGGRRHPDALRRRGRRELPDDGSQQAAARPRRADTGPSAPPGLGHHAECRRMVAGRGERRHGEPGQYPATRAMEQPERRRAPRSGPRASALTPSPSGSSARSPWASSSPACSPSSD